MNIGLINIEPTIFNTAYMQISAFHKLRGDSVRWWMPISDYNFDFVYCSSLFDFTDKTDVPEHAICGGTGFDVNSRLSVAMEACDPDYSIYPKCRTSFVWFSRGCDRNCPWCVVRQKEGEFHLVKRKNLNPEGQYITIMDNDFFANPNWRDVISRLGDTPVDIQGIDVRRLTAEKCGALNKLRRWKKKQFKIAWDNPKDDVAVLDGIELLTKYVKPYKIMCYVLIGWNSEEWEDLTRVRMLSERGIDPYVMPYNKRDAYQKAFARWVNNKAIYKKVKWEDYRQRVSRQELAGTGWKN